MKTYLLGLGALVAATIASCGAASASIVVVGAHSGPWDPSIVGNAAFGVGDNLAAASLTVLAGDMITVTYLSGTTSAFNGAPPSVDALGYVGGVFGSGLGFTGVGSSGTFFPSHAIDPSNTGGPIYLSALIGDFVNSSGVVLGVFAPGDGPFTIQAPTGAVAVQFGVNDDIFADNSGALRIDVSGASGGVPEPATWTLLLGGLGGVGGALRSGRNRRARQVSRA